MSDRNSIDKVMDIHITERKSPRRQPAPPRISVVDAYKSRFSAHELLVLSEFSRDVEAAEYSQPDEAVFERRDRLIRISKKVKRFTIRVLLGCSAVDARGHSAAIRGLFDRKTLEKHGESYAATCLKDAIAEIEPFYRARGRSETEIEPPKKRQRQYVRRAKKPQPDPDLHRSRIVNGSRLRNGRKQRLTHDEVLLVVAMCQTGNRHLDVAKTLCVSESTISMIMAGHRWSNITGIKPSETATS